MSTRDDDEFKLGETYTVVVDCRDYAGAPVTPVTASFAIKTFGGAVIVALTQASGITINGNSCIISIPTYEQTGFEPGLYRKRLKITDSNNAVSRQMDGTTEILADE